jgi:enamine deaminase RidA (YjgF/YER057c/UK114 family)
VALTIINPEELGPPCGYSNGVLSDCGGRLLFIAGQVAWNSEQQIVSSDFVDQFDRALENVLTVVKQAGGSEGDIARLIIYVTDKPLYRQHTKEVGERYRKHMGKHYPAMVLVEVKSLLEDNALVEIEGIAVLNP